MAVYTVEKKEKKTFFEYDLIRTIAVIAVVCFHIHEEMKVRGILSPLPLGLVGKNIGSGPFGVVLFILMSGTLSYFSYDRCIKSCGGLILGKDAIITFYRKKVMALLPLFWIGYIFAYLLALCTEPIILAPMGGLLTPRILFSIAGMDGYLLSRGIQTNYLVGEWFMGLILLLYFLVPLLYWLIRKWPKQIAIGLVIYYIVVSLCYPDSFGPRETDVCFRVVDFTIGMYFAVYAQYISKKVIGIACVLLIPLMTIFLPLVYYNEWRLLQGVLVYTILLGAGRILAPYKNRLMYIIKAVCNRTAQYAYAIFLTHHVIINKILNQIPEGQIGIRRTLYYIVVIVIFIAFASVMITALEKHIRAAWKKPV